MQIKIILRSSLIIFTLTTNINNVLFKSFANILYFKDMGIQITNVMDYSATVVLSPPKDLSKMYNFVSKIERFNNFAKNQIWIINFIPINFQTGVKSNLPRDDINLQFCRGVLKERRNMLEDLKISSIRRKSLLDPQTILLLKSQEESNM